MSLNRQRFDVCRWAAILAVSVTVLVGGVDTALAAPIVASTFDTGLEGWTTNDSGAFGHVVAGGNPGGHLRLDNCECMIAHILAPVAFLGDLSPFVGGSLSFDGNLLGAGGTFFDGPNGIPGGTFLDYGIVRMVGPTLSAQIDLLPGGATAPLQSWQTFSVALTAAAWGLSSGDFATLMQNVTSLSITVEGLWGAEVQGIDNIRLSGPAPAAPEPATLLLMTAAIVAGTTRPKTRGIPDRQAARTISSHPSGKERSEG
jgi:hypothetical protein